MRKEINCRHWSEQHEKHFGMTHHFGAHACDPDLHDGECPWWAEYRQEDRQ